MTLIAATRKARMSHSPPSPSDPTRHGVEDDDSEPAADTTPLGRARVRSVASRVARRMKANRRKKTRRKRRLVALAAIVSILVGLVGVGGSIFFANVALPEDLDAKLAQNSTVYYSDGKTVMGNLGTQKRTSVKLSQIPEHLQWAVISAEDQGFYHHTGVDFWGVMRALWNNVTGGDTQGASTLTQQYVGQVADIRGDGSYLRKAREAVMAMKMEERFGKKSILNHYLNLVYFGRGAYGVQAAAHAFFGKSVEKLNVSESALLAAQIRAPNGSYDPGDPLGKRNAHGKHTPQGRWSYVLDQMVKTGKLTSRHREELTKLPDTVDPNSLTGSGADKPTGFVTSGLVLEELHQRGIKTESVLRGGYHITTTINHDLEDKTVSAVAIATKKKKDAGIAVVEPGTGKILAYYGGPKATGADQASAAVPHPAGTTFNAVTALAAVGHGATTATELDGRSPLKVKGRAEPVENTGGVSKSHVMLADAVIKKLDTPMYRLADKIGPDKVAATARDLGVTQLREPYTGKGSPKTLSTDDAKAGWTPDVGIGSYGMSVTDSANTYATIADVGKRATPHVIAKVTNASGETVYSPKSSSKRTVDQADAASVGSLLAHAPDADLVDHGTPMMMPMTYLNASPTWYCGATSQWSMSVWSGDGKHEGDGSSPKNTTAQRVWEEISPLAYQLFPEDNPKAPDDGGVTHEGPSSSRGPR
jgi:membrane peptidoglycan carboxypeptidase